VDQASRSGSVKRVLLLLAALAIGTSAGAQTAKKKHPPAKLPKKVAPAEAPNEIEPAAIPAAQSAAPQRVGIDSANSIRLNYGFSSWNKNPTQVDSASLLMREGSTGRTVQISLVETAPDSSVFSGIYSINWQNLEKLQVEFYIPPQELLNSQEGLKKTLAMIASKALKRKPFILRRTPTGAQLVELFDNRDQARSAMKAYRAEQQIQAMQDQKPTKFPSDQQVDTAKMAEELKAKEYAAKIISDRIRVGQVEARRLQDLIAKFSMLREPEKIARRKKAEAIAAEAMQLFKQEKYQEARSKFDQALELDPDNRLFYFQYGVTLYRVDEFNRSLVMLQLAEGPSVNPVERDYFVGLNHYRIKEFPPAIEAFDKVVATKNPDMAPSAKFYEGVVYFEQKDWEKSRPAFQAVLDSSKDPKLDERAENYLEQILRIQQFEAERSRKWQISGTLGEMVDSNVLLIADSSTDSGTASNTAGNRTLLTGSFRYRPIYEQTREFAAQLDLVTMYTVDKNLKGAQSLRNADPTMATLTLPWTTKGLIFGKGNKFDVTPGIESIWMSIEDDQNKEILQSYLLTLSDLIVMSNTWFSTFALELRSENSKLNSSTGDDDSSAFKTKLGNSNLVFVSDDKSKIVLVDGGYTINSAKGRNTVYDRIDLGLGYIQPIFWGLSGNAKLSFFNLVYSQNANGRIDNSYTLALGASRPISDIWSAGLLGSYNINNSNIDANAYKKYSILLTFSGTLGF
jgi:tetratricopeptide (TPR) repeat protein